MSSSASEVLAELRSWSPTGVEQVHYLNLKSRDFYEAGDVANSRQLDEEIRRLVGEISEQGGHKPSGEWISNIEYCLAERQDSRSSPVDSLDDYSDFDDNIDDIFELLPTRSTSRSPTGGGAEEFATPLQHLPPTKENVVSGIPHTAGPPVGIQESSKPIPAVVHGHSPPVTPPRTAQSHQTTTSLGTENTTADGWFKDLANQTHQFVFGEEGKFMLCGDKRIKIAVLDSGLAFSDQDEYYNLTAIWKSIAGGETFIDVPWNEDDYGHGTAVASVIAKTAPNALLYIARISRYDEHTKTAPPNQNAVAAAIRHAVDVWKVDVINMSFGWLYDDHKGVRDALKHAAERHVDRNGVITEQPVLMFAATSNFGVTQSQSIYWPSRSNLVISIDSADGLGNEAKETSSIEDNTGKLRFTAPGVDVACNYPLHKQPPKTPEGTLVRQTGASFACGVASGIAALILEFANQEPCSWFSKINDNLRRKRAMELLFLEMSKTKTVKRFTFLYPWRLLVGDDDEPSGGEATPHTQRWDTAYKIAGLLDKEYRPKPLLRKQFLPYWLSRDKLSSSV